MSDADDSDDHSTSTDASGNSALLLRQTSSSDDSDLDQPLTYLQLGAYPTWGTVSQRGDDLLSSIGLTSTSTQFFADDHRSANGYGAPGTTYTRDDGYSTTSSSASALTAELMTRGGVRLHTDGNYLSTTRGDRVEVVFGNHHQSVLGRTNGSSFWESSGGLVVKDDAATFRRATSVQWDESHSTFRTYEETTKGNLTSRFQGPLETTFECETLVESIGRAITDDADETPSIPASSSVAHQQTDASDHWINPSSGAGTGWPRSQVTPDLDRRIAATSVSESIKVTSGMGTASTTGKTAGVFDDSRIVDNSWSRTRSATSQVKDVVRASSGATVTEAIGFKSELIGDGTGGDRKLDSYWRNRFYLGGYESALFEEKQTTVLGGSTWLAETIIDVVGVHISATASVRLISADLGHVPNPTFTSSTTYGSNAWSGWNALGTTLGLALFGAGDTDIRVLVPTLEYCVARASVNVSLYKSRVSADHVEAHLAGAHTEIGLGKLICSLTTSMIEAVKSDSGAVHLSLAGVLAKS